MDRIIEIIQNILNYEYKWFVIALAVFVLIYLVVLLIPCRVNKKASKENKKELVDKESVEVVNEVNNLQNVEKNNEEVSEKNIIIADNPQKEENTKTLGKWVIKKKSDEDFILNLVANNGEIILASESHTTALGAKISLSTLKKNIEKDQFKLHCDKKNQYFFKLKDSSNKLLAMGQVYSTKKSAQKSIESVKRFCNADLIEEVFEDLTYIKYNATELKIGEVKEGYRGKWIISKVEETFQAKLHASNGEILLVTERYASINSVYSAIETIKKNANLGNFIIDCDKNKNYFYRLRNANKLTLAIGETYTKISAVNSSIESVRKFSETADIIEKIEE